MAFTWVESLSAGILIEYPILEEIQHNADYLHDNISCTSYNGNHKAAENSGVLATNDSSALVSNDSAAKTTQYVSNLSGYESGVNTGDNGSVNTTYGDIDCSTNDSFYESYNNVRTGCNYECGPGGNYMGGVDGCT
jgi:hypothetical protein